MDSRLANQEKNKKVFADRKRTNILRKNEQVLILYLLEKIPSYVSPNMMTVVGFLGSIIVFSAFTAAIFFGRIYLTAGFAGLALNWLGDSLDGRLAYYREIPRKWYGFTLDIIMDWLSIILIGMSYYFYAPGNAKIFGFLFVVLYGWAMMLSLMRYKITDLYKIDSGKLGPTELRIIIILILLVEIMIPYSIIYSAALITCSLFVINIKASILLLRDGDDRDEKEKQ